MKRTITRLAGGVALLAAMAAAPVLGAEMPAESGKRAGMEELIKILKEKGVISDAEAARLGERVRGGETATPHDSEEGKVEVARLTYDELSDFLDTMNDQGLISEEETVELKDRLEALRKGVKAKPAVRVAAGERKTEGNLFAGKTIEYRRTTKPEEEVIGMIATLRGLGLVNRDEAAALRERYRAKADTDRFAGTIIGEVNKGIGKSVDRKMTEGISRMDDRLAKLPEWTNRLRFSGDLRLRYQGDFFDENNGDFVRPDRPTELLNSKIDRQRARIRARFGITAKVNDRFDAGISLATGNTTDPVSTNQTLGDSLNKKPINLDLAYIKWQAVPELSVMGGRFASPWFSTDLVWDSDVNFDGIAFQYTPKLTDSLKLFLSGGAFPIQEIEFSGHDKWLLGGQLGLTYSRSENFAAKLGVAFYNFENTVGEANDPSRPGEKDFTAPQFQQKGNTLFDIDPSNALKTAYASEFRELNATGSLDIGIWRPVHIVLLADYVNNLGFESAEVNARTGTDVKKYTEGYHFGVAVGHPSVRDSGEWKGFFSYKYLGADAVIDAFTDSDFHLGGTNAKGWILGGDIGLAKNVWLTTRWLTANEIAGPPLAIDVFQLDINARF